MLETYASLPTLNSQLTPTNSSESCAVSACRQKSPQKEIPAKQMGDHLMPRSCIRCRNRKVRCNRQKPCMSCMKMRVECVYLSSTERRPRGAGKNNLSGTKKDGLARIAKLETLLESINEKVHTISHQRGIDLSAAEEGHHREVDVIRTDLEPESLSQPKGAKTVQVHISNTNIGNTGVEATENRKPYTPTRLWVIRGKTLYINDWFWANLSEEVDDKSEMLSDDAMENPRSHPPDSTAPSFGSHSSIFGIPQPASDPLKFYPSPSQVTRYWRIFLQNVDPIFHILHQSSIEIIIRSATYDPTKLTKCDTTILFAICFSAINSMSDEQVMTEFRKPKATLLSRCRVALEHAFAVVGLINTKELGVLQAFLLYLICIRGHDDSHKVWMLTGLAIRVALSFGLHRDGENFGLLPFETEMRRRLWCQIYGLEIRVAEDQGYHPTIVHGSFDTKLPLNLNDRDLHPNATVLPPEHVGLTDVTFGLLRYEILALDRSLQPYNVELLPESQSRQDLSVSEKLRRISTCEERLQRTYLQHGHPNKPMTILARILTRATFAKMRLIVQNPYYSRSFLKTDDSKTSADNKLDPANHERLFILSISCLEDFVFLYSDPTFKQWSWLSRRYIQWHPIAFILTELCHRQPSALSFRAWAAVNGVLQANETHAGEMVCDRRDGALWRPIMKLISKAKRGPSARQIQSRNEGGVSNITRKTRKETTVDVLSEIDISGAMAYSNNGDFVNRNYFSPLDSSNMLPHLPAVNTTMSNAENSDGKEMSFRMNVAGVAPNPAKTSPETEDTWDGTMGSQQVWDELLRDYLSETKENGNFNLQPPIFESMSDWW